MVGSAIQTNEQNKYAKKVSNARATAAALENKRQDEYSRASEAAVHSAQQGFDVENQTQQLEEAQQQRADRAQSAITAQTAYEAAPGVPQVINDQLARAINEGLQEGKDTTKNRAFLSAFGNLDLANKIRLNSSGQRVNTFQNFARGSNALLPLEMEAAAEGVKSPSLFGGMLSLAGQGLGLYGMSKMGTMIPTEGAGSAGAKATIDAVNTVNNRMNFVSPTLAGYF